MKRWAVLVVVGILSLVLSLVAFGCGRADLGLESSVGVVGADGGVGDAQGDGAPSDGPVDGNGVLVSIDVTPPVANVAVGTKLQLKATGTFSDKTTQDLTASATWTSSASNVASVASGVVSASTPGTATITATVNGIKGTARITVPNATVTSIAITPANATTAVGGTVNFKAVATLSNGTTQDVTATATWASATTSVATIAAGGVATGVAPGQTAITATAAGVTGKASLTVSGATLVSITITPTNPTVGTNVTFPLTATGNYSDGSIADLTQTAQWASSSANVATISTTGVVTTVSPGTTNVTASVGNVTGQTLVTVTSATLKSIDVTPAQSTLAINATEPLKATGTYSDGTTFDLTQTVTWSSGSPGVANVSNAAGSQGVVTALSAGTATITASLGPVSGTATVTVSPATLTQIAITPQNPTVPRNTTLQFVARGTYSDGSVLDVTTQAAWSTDDQTVATISNAPGSQGLASAIAVGSTLVHATLNGQSAQTTITVSTAVLQTIVVAPANATMVLGDKAFYTATGHYSDGSTVDLTTTAVWSTGNAQVATVSNVSGAQGLVTATGPGTTNVTATYQGVSGSTNVTVTAPTLAQVVVNPINPTIRVGQNQQFTAIAIYSNNTQRNVTQQATWSSSNTGVASMNGPPGRATGVSAGTSTITATFQGMSGSTTLTVTNAVPVSVEVTPINPTMPAGTAQQFQATAIMSDNTSQNVTAQATWTSSNAAVAAVQTAGGGRGRVTAIAAGTATITATWQGLSGSSTVTVTSATIVSISVSPATASDAVGATRQFTAQAIYSDGTSRDVTGGATWTSSNPSVAGVNDAAQKGLATAIAPGTVTITAAFQGLSGTASYTVTSATLTDIQVTPIAPSVSKGTPVQFQATAIYSDNTSRNITGQATWTSSNTSVAAVSDAVGSKGLTQTLSAGSATIQAAYQGKSGSTTITVTAATLTQIQVTPFSPTLPVGFTTQLQATGIYSDNTTQDLTGLATWTSSASSVASVSDAAGSKGRLSPLAAGQATITATYQGVSGTDAVTVSSATLQSIAVTPNPATVAVGATQPFTATGTFSDNSTMDVTIYVTWFSSNTQVAPISNAGGSQGQAKGLSAGTTTITATRGSVNGTASLTVQ